MTGAKIPTGCNSVVMQENTVVHGGAITLTQQAKAGDNIRKAGNDIQKDTLLLNEGKRLGPIDIGLLATLGQAKVAVYRKVRVGLFSTGDEITPLGSPLKDGFIYDSNRYLLHAALQRLDIEIKNYGNLPDDPAIIESTFIQAALECDAIISSGGVSVGDADFTRDVLQKLGDITFYTLAMKPGKPFAFGTITTPANPSQVATFFGLPGNPVSAAVTFHQLALPTIRRMGGENVTVMPILHLPCDTPLRKSPGRVDFQRANLHTQSDGTLSVTTTGTQSSGALSSLSKADCYIRLEQDRGNVAAGEMVDVIPLDNFLR
jgi:molybdenum cofactor synthesis domain